MQLGLLAQARKGHMISFICCIIVINSVKIRKHKHIKQIAFGKIYIGEKRKRQREQTPRGSTKTFPTPNDMHKQWIDYGSTPHEKKP